MKKLLLSLIVIVILGAGASCTPESPTTFLPAASNVPSPSESAPFFSTVPLIPFAPQSAASSSPSSSTPSASTNTLNFDSRLLTNNVWGAPPGEVFSSGIYRNGDQDYGWYWSRESPLASQPGSTLIFPLFPNVRVGGGPGVKSNSPNFPLLASDIALLKFESAYKYLTLPTGTYNLAYEMLFFDQAQPPSGLVPKAEVMIWIHATFTQPPSADRGFVSDGANYYHYFSWTREDGRLYAAFIMEGKPQFEALHSVDARALLNNVGIDPRWYLPGIELGSEIVKGSGKIRISRFSVNVNGKES